jgi:regulator of microtubule dynamics protein 3
MKNNAITKPPKSGGLSEFEKISIVVVCILYLMLALSTATRAQALNVSPPAILIAVDSVRYARLINVLETNPDDLQLLLSASKLAGQLGGRVNKGNCRDKYIIAAKRFALTAIKQDPTNVDAHFYFIISLGLASENASSSKERLQNAKVIKKEADLILSLDPDHAGTYYVLGKWHEGLSRLTTLEKIVCNTFLGGVPEGASYANALRCFQRAIQLQPDFILFHYGLAHAFESAGDTPSALRVLRKAICLPARESDDIVRKNNCITLLKKLNPTIL